MAIPGPGQALPFANQIQREFGGSNPIGLSEYYRGSPTGYVPNSPSTATIPTSGTISASNFYGTTRRVSVPITISSPTYNYCLYANRGPTYISGISDVVLTVNPGVTVSSPSPASYAMLVPSSFSAGDTVTIVNNGSITGSGGNGGIGGNTSTCCYKGKPGTSGGNALYVNRPTTVYNNGSLYGGGGGGGGGGMWVSPAPSYRAYGGGGGGGGAGVASGAGGAGGQGCFPTAPASYRGSDGSAGTSTTGGTGGNLAPGAPSPSSYKGGTGGAIGSSGGAGATRPGPPNYLGGYCTYPGGCGGAAGYYIVGNPYVTWGATGTRAGSVG